MPPYLWPNDRMIKCNATLPLAQEWVIGKLNWMTESESDREVKLNDRKNDRKWIQWKWECENEI